MKRLQYINLFGVLALAILCIFQWQANRKVNLEVNRLEQLRLGQAGKLDEQTEKIHGLEADLTDFKQRFATAQSEADETRKRLAGAERDVRQLAAERDQLKTSVTN